MEIMKSSGFSQGKWEFDKLMWVRVSDKIRRSIYVYATCSLTIALKTLSLFLHSMKRIDVKWSPGWMTKPINFK